MADLLDRILQRVGDLAQVPIDVRQRVEVEIRQELGGTDGGYIAKRPALRQAVAMGAQLQAGVPLGQAMRNAGCSRSTGYRILGKSARR